MKKNKTNPYYQKKLKKKSPSPLRLLLYFLLYIIFLFVTNHPKLQTFRDTLFYQIMLKLSFSLAIIYFNWIKAKTIPLIGKSFSTVLTLRFWIPFSHISPQFLLIADTIFAFAFIIYLLFLYIDQGKHYSVLSYEACFFAFFIFLEMSGYTYVSRSGELWFMYFALVIALVPTAISIILLLSNRIKLKNQSRSEYICIPIIVYFISFCLIWCTTCNLNYALDQEDTVEYSALLIEKDLDNSPKAGTSYFLIVSLDNTRIKMEVSQSEYYSYEIGDLFPIILHQGAFNEPFYLSGTN